MSDLEHISEVIDRVLPGLRVDVVCDPNDREFTVTVAPPDPEAELNFDNPRQLRLPFMD